MHEDLRKVVDVFLFYNELNLLEIRLETLDPYVDFFLIVEADETFSGNKKEFIFLENQEKFSKFNDKIIHLPISSFPSNLSPFAREWAQRNAILPKLTEFAREEYLIVFGDVDEIPSPRALEYALGHDFAIKPIIHCAQDLFYYYLNLRETSGTLLSFSGDYRFVLKKKWLGTVICEFGYLKSFEMATFRSPSQKRFGRRIKNGGWHFSFVGEAEALGVEHRIKDKIKSYAHQEYNNDAVFGQVLNNVMGKLDLFGRKKSKFRKLKNLDSLPLIVQNNLERYRESLMK